MAWIKTVEPNDATGGLKNEYMRAVARAGKVFNILKIQSLNPDTLYASMNLYLATMHGPSGLSRTERELLAVVVSRANNCFY
ncbi:MAG TPA: carboxymuconolactone decarboxylase family protein [Terriglobia bacterium]|nr:carboxymuconolactone decarboxylase family protein [Terriglobia bacterium]